MDLMVFEAKLLCCLRRDLRLRYGTRGLAAVLPKTCTTLEDKVRFGEYTLYAVYLLDVLRMPVPSRNSNSHFLAQVHSQTDLANFEFDSKVVHFVDKRFSMEYLKERLSVFGLG